MVSHTIRRVQALGKVIFDVNRESLSANKSIVVSDSRSQYLDPNGSDRDVTLYASPTAGDYFLVKNIGSANILTLKNNGGTTITTIAINVAVAVQYDGTEWQLV